MFVCAGSQQREMKDVKQKEAVCSDSSSPSKQHQTNRNTSDKECLSESPVIRDTNIPRLKSPHNCKDLSKGSSSEK